MSRHIPHPAHLPAGAGAWRPSSIFGAPLLIAGIIGLVTGIVVVAFVSSMRLYGFIDIIIGASLIASGGQRRSSVPLSPPSSVAPGATAINTLILLARLHSGIVVVLNFISFENTSREWM